MEKRLREISRFFVAPRREFAPPSERACPRTPFSINTSTSVLQLPCCPSKQGEVLENRLKNLRNKWPPHPVQSWQIAMLITIGNGGAL